MDTMPPPESTPTERPRRRNGWKWVPLVLALFWLVPSIIIGVKLITDEPSKTVSVQAPAPNLSSSAEEQAYGGDAYTGIQNAAAETEKAVVDGFNQLGNFQLALENSMAQQQAEHAAASQAHIEDGLGFLIIALAVVNLTVAVGRLTSNRVVSA